MRKLPRQWAALAGAPDFLRFFVGNTGSILGGSITGVALPLTAVLLLDASPGQMGVLGALTFLPHLVLGLPAGVWVARISYRRTVVLADYGQALLIGVVPVLALLDVLALWNLYVVALLSGGCVLFGSVAATSYVPTLVGRERLLPANSAIAQSTSVVTTVGPAVAGVLVQVLTGPITLALSAVSFVGAASCRRTIRNRGRPSRPAERGTMLGEIGGGMRTVFGHPILRPMILSASFGALAGQLQAVIVVLFLARELGLSPTLVGIMLAVNGVATVVGAILATPVTARVGHGPGFILGGFIASLAGFGLAAAAGPLQLTLVVLTAAQVLRGLGPPLYSINQVTIRQALSTPELLTRVNATWRFLVFGTQPIGAMLGGLLGGELGLRTTFVIGSFAMLLAVAIAVWSPLRSFRDLPS